ncbi:MAG: glycosyl transferase family 2 [Pirellula sp.]|nr:glycosyl transferase family 2 [Pirellula sp.]
MSSSAENPSQRDDLPLNSPALSQSSREVDLSIIVPVYFNARELEATLATLRREVVDVVLPLTAEIVFVDDGSGDDSFAVLQRLRKQHPQLVRLVKLTRNFGQANATRAGFEHARGKFLVAISADGQDPASLIVDMLRAHRDEGFELVIAYRTGRDESLFRRATSRIFYSLIRRLSFPNMPEGGFDFVGFSRRVLRVLQQSPEANPFFQGEFLWTGYAPKFLPYHRAARAGEGRSRWTFRKKLTFFIDGIVSYSDAPLRWMSLTGIGCALLGILYAVIIFVSKLRGNVPVEGWAPMMIVVLVLGGVQMLMLGVLGEYVWRALAEARGRPRYLVERTFLDPPTEEAESETPL